MKGKAMKVSGAGAAVGGLVGCIARGSVVLLNLGAGADKLSVVALPSAGIGLLVGAIAGAIGRPLLGAAVGAVLSGVVFELFMCACASLIGTLSQEAGDTFLSRTLIYGLEMAVAGAVAGGVGGLVGQVANAPRCTEPSARLHLDAGTSRKEPRGGAEKPSEGIQDFRAGPGAAADRGRDAGSLG
jgi:hypothetical protein